MTSEQPGPGQNPTDTSAGLSNRIRARRTAEAVARQRRDRRMGSVAAGIAGALGMLSAALGLAGLLGSTDQGEAIGRGNQEADAATISAIMPSAGAKQSTSTAATAAKPVKYEPRRSYRGFETWQRNAAALPAGKGPLISIVIDDMGLKKDMTEKFSKLPAVLTFAFLPYADDLPKQTQLVHARGHELLLHLPMEPLSNANDPGPQALDVERSPGDLLNRLIWNLGRFDGYVGINNHMGSRYTADFEHMATILGELDRRGLMFLDSLTSPSSRGYKIARDMNMAWSSRDVFLDNKREVGAIAAQLAETARIARTRGYAVAIGHPYPQTLEALTQFIHSPGADGLRFAPVSATVHQGTSAAADNSWRTRLAGLRSGG